MRDGHILEREPRLAVVFLDGEYADPAWHRALAGSAAILVAADGGARYLAGLDTRMVISWQGKTLNITNILDLKGRHLVLKIRAYEAA